MAPVTCSPYGTWTVCFLNNKQSARKTNKIKLCLFKNKSTTGRSSAPPDVDLLCDLWKLVKSNYLSWKYISINNCNLHKTIGIIKKNIITTRRSKGVKNLIQFKPNNNTNLMSKHIRRTFTLKLAPSSGGGKTPKRVTIIYSAADVLLVILFLMSYL